MNLTFIYLMLFVDADDIMETDITSTPPIRIKEEVEEHCQKTNLQDLNMEAGQEEPSSRDILGKDKYGKGLIVE